MKTEKIQLRSEEELTVRIVKEGVAGFVSIYQATENDEKSRAFLNKLIAVTTGVILIAFVIHVLK